MDALPLFISYSHKDTNPRNQLEKWLISLRDKCLIADWSDSQLVPGDRFMDEIAKKMDEAAIILILLSQNYLSSQSCLEEMRYALGVSKNKRVIPIILRDCTWRDTGCKDLLVLPKDGYPISSSYWESREKAWLNIYEGIKKAAEDIKNSYSFSVKEDFEEDIQSIEFVTQNKERPILDDLFVFPNLNRDKAPFEREKVGLDYFLDGKTKSILMIGSEFSGKTAFARWLFLKLREKFNTILLDGGTIHKTLNFDDHVKKEFAKQMTGDFNCWKSTKNKVAIIDDYQHKISPNIIDYLDQNYVMSIIFLSEEEFYLYFKDDPNFSAYSKISLVQFTLVQQEELIRKWLSLNQKSSLLDVDDLAVDKLEERVNNIVMGNRIVPRYPFFILSILQAFEAFMPGDYQITAYGHCYQALVTAILVKKSVKYEDIDTSFNYLKNLSFAIYKNERNGTPFSQDIYGLFREEYKTKYIITDSLVHKIENDDYPLLSIKKDVVAFRYSYLYYFFLGMYVAASEDDVLISSLCKDIHRRENAFILIFTIHHTQNKKLLDTIRLHCIYSFEKVVPATLTVEETQFMTDVMSELPQSIISSRDTLKNRREEREKRDLAIEHEESNKENDDNYVDVMEINKGIKILDVLGQILKNRAGSFERSEVLDILDEAINLGLRILNLFLGECRKPEFKEWLSKSLEDAERELERNKNRKFDDQQRKIFIEKTIQLFGYLMTIGMLNRISYSICSEKLITSLAILSDRVKTPAYEMIDFLVSLSQKGIDPDIVISLKTEFNRSKNYWAEKTLSYYVQNYLNTHNVKFQERQRITSALNIKYLPNKGQ